MINALTIKSAFAGLALFGALVIVPQQASAGFHFGGFHGGGAPRMAVASFRPVFRPAFRPVVRFAAPRIRMGGAHFGGYRLGGYHFGGRPTRFAGLGRHGGERGLGHEHGRTRLGRLDHDKGRHVRLPHGGIVPAFYQPDYAEPDSAAQGVVTPPAGPVGPAALAATSTGPASGTSVATCAAAGSFVAVQFAPKTTASDISTFLKAYNVTIVDGPTKNGSYRVRLSDKPLPPSEILQAIQSMQSQTAIVSAVSPS